MVWVRIIRSLPLAFTVAPFVVLASMDNVQQTKPIIFEGEVQTLLKAHCGTCHSGQDKSAELDLTSYAGVMKGGYHGKAVVAGNADKSLLVMRLEGKGGKDQMPLGFKPLAPEKIAKIRAWINGGCKTSGASVTHWAYVAPKLPPVPRVKDSKWIGNPIDNFVLAKLESQGMHPSPVATKRTLIRRLYLDLTGLPPTPKEVKAFNADNDPKAYEKTVDRLLASKAYGEKMAMPWLDLARYADSDGYEKDLNRTAWKYRDWVIEAFNSNMPYDQFTTKQIAGDMLPKPTLDDLVATGFNRNSMFNSEGGVDPAEAQFNVIIDRVNTVSTVWLGSTLQCARCHDHKYDPFTQKDFYKLYAVFNNTVYTKNGDYKTGQETWTEPSIEVPTPEQKSKVAALTQEVSQLDEKLKNPGQDVLKDFDHWLQTASSAEMWSKPQSVHVVAASAKKLQELPDGSLLALGEAPQNDTYTVTFKATDKQVTGVRVEVLADDSLPMKGPGRASSGNFILTKVELAAHGIPVPINRITTGFTQQGYDAQRAIEGDTRSGWAIYPENGQENEMLIEPAAPLEADDLTLKLTFGSQEWPQHEIGRFRVSTTGTEKPAILSKAIKAMLADPAKIDANRPSLLAEYEKTSRLTGPLVKSLGEKKAMLAALKGQIPTALVVQENPNGAAKANIHIRGEFLQKGDEVNGGPPACLGPTPSPTPFNRLSFANWLTNKSNPLTARVEVNRLWEALFGRGIVETSEDFGTQGSAPSHPELLDWLAVTFIDSGWDVKGMVKRIVMSSTYRQTSTATPDLLEKDPLNILLGRAPRFRLPAEVVRDNMLTIGGILDRAIGGPSVYPSQPPAIWDTPYNGEQWMTSNGAEKYRRGLYTFWKRSAPYPSFVAMDATSRETCTVRRLRTNTPLQALALLNDEVTMDAARGLAQRMQKEDGASEDSQLRFAFEACTGRLPSLAELDRIKKLSETLVERYQKDTAAMKLLATSPQSASNIMVCNTLLNLDETISRS